MLLVCTDPSAKPARQSGFSLVELMVAMLLSLILLGGVLAIFASSRQTYETTDQLSRIQENGRFALDVIVRDLRGAGFTGCSKRSAYSSSLRTPTSLLWNFERPIEGFDGQGSGWLPNTLDTTVVISPAAAGDVLAIRLPRGEFEPQRLTTFMTAQSSPVQIANVTPALINAGDVVQVADCQSRAVFQVSGNVAGALAHADVPAGLTTPGNLSADLGAAFTEQSEVVAMRSVIYFLRAGSTAGAGTSLWRRVSGATAPEEVVEGVESLQFQYGEDTDGDNVIAVDEYRTANLVTDWNQVLSVRVALLVRSLSEYGNDADARAYQVLERNIPAPNDRRLRQIFTTTVTLRNAAT
jgi:type IV pilus assembly protein PilW